ncbi:hypothetical protein Pan216_40730 [Planctomycetes bacterium Pan216]|uniref:Uncharacterized protein n=1 Tax=Kolteria novifilia TaxID=2527975 RepID=A0A518B895_9BACT|nr:hypothetical protein Pan216_40730 [Planctomycetes bacterium Pan216]
MNVDPVQVLRRLPVGTALYDRTHHADGSWEVHWMIREECGTIERYGKHPDFEVRAGLFRVRPTPSGGVVALVPVLFRIGPRALYETWINEYADDEPTLWTLAGQPRLRISIYGDGDKPVQSFQAENLLARFSRDAWERIHKLAAWSMDDFEQARDMLYRKFPGSIDLWRQLEGQQAGGCSDESRQIFLDANANASSTNRISPYLHRRW